MESITVGIDLAKSVFSVCVVSGSGRVTQRRELKRAALPGWLKDLPAGTVVGMEACSGANHWGRQCQSLGLVPRLMAAQFVKPYRKNGAVKNDRQDAEAIVTAVRQGNMRFVSVKTVEQQARLSWHRVREGFKKDGLAVANRIRGLLAEFGIVIDKSDAALRHALADLESWDLPPEMRELLRQQQRHWQAIEAEFKVCTKRIVAHAKADPKCKDLQGIIGLGPIGSDAAVAMAGNAREFSNGRQFSAWLGLTPSQFGTGGRVTLGAISRRGDSYLRMLLIQGARSSLNQAKHVAPERATAEQKWILQLALRMPFGKVLAAIANKHARQIWAMLARGEEYDPEAWLRHPMVQRG